MNEATTARAGRTAPPAGLTLFCADWLRSAQEVTAASAPEESTALRMGLRITDAPREVAREVLVLVDTDTGRLSFRAGEWGERPLLTLALGLTDAAVLLFGDAEQRVRLFESGGVHLEGIFLYLFFLDRLLQQDPTGVMAQLRALTAGVPSPTAAPWPPAAAPASVREAAAGYGAQAEAVRTAADTLPRTMAALQRELGRTTPGAQLYVSHAATGTEISVAVGEARPGVAFTRDSLPIWYCCSKTVGAVAIGQLWERGLLDPLRPVADYLPWFAGEGRESVTLYQILTHTTTVPLGLDPLHGTMTAPMDLRRELLARMKVPTDTAPGARINYSPWWGWFLLSEVVRAVDGRSYEQYLTEEVLAPCKMSDTRVVFDPQEYRRLAAELPLIHITGGGLPAQPTHWYATEAACTRPIPGLNLRGPMSDLGRFFEALAAGGQGSGGRILRPQTVMALTAHLRVGLTDPFGNADWGLGFRMESHYLGEACTAYSRHASLRTFGHYGLWTSVAFADPDVGLVVALHLNGKAWQDEHQARTMAIGDAVYEDLQLV